MKYGSKAWVLNNKGRYSDQPERCIVQKMCRVNATDRLKDKIAEYARKGSMRWIGHALRKNNEECVKKHVILSSMKLVIPLWLPRID